LSETVLPGRHAGWLLCMGLFSIFWSAAGAGC
jgi:hypothetical protein